MTGVEVLATEEVVTGSSFNWLGFAITFIAVILVNAFIFAYKCETRKDFLQCVGMFGGILGFLFGFFIGASTALPMEYETHYKVTISDEVSLNEFLERYEIIDQEGQIYTIRELEGKDRD